MQSSNWLPRDTAPPAALVEMMGTLVVQWSDHWFAGPPLRSDGRFVRIDDARWTIDGVKWRDHAGAAIGISDQSLLCLGAAMLGLATGSDRGEADRALLLRLGDETVCDLQQRLGQAMKLPAEKAWSASDAPRHRDPHTYGFEIVRAGRTAVLRVEVTGARFAALVKSALPRRPSAPLGNGRQALAMQPVQIGAAVGACRLTLAELAGLGTGDVLILDRRAEAELPLVVDGSATSGAFMLAGDAETLALRVSKPLFG